MKININNIKAKVFILLGVALLVLSASGFFILRQASQIQEASLLTGLENQAIDNAEVLELKIQKDLYSLRVASKSPVLLDEDINVALTYLEGLLEEKKEMGSNIITLGIVTLDGYRRETTDFERTSYRGDRDWFKAIVAGAPHAFASPGFSSAYPDLLRIPLVVPIYKDGQLYRILHSRLGLNQLVPLMEEMKFGERAGLLW